METLKIKRFNETITLPKYAHEGDAGLDIYSTECHRMLPGDRVTIGCMLSIKLPENTLGLIQGRSGNASKRGLTTIGNVIDEGYSGEIHVILCNTGREEVEINVGDKIAQLLIIPVCHVEVIDTLDIEGGLRGEAGLGSTGV